MYTLPNFTKSATANNLSYFEVSNKFKVLFSVHFYDFYYEGLNGKNRIENKEILFHFNILLSLKILILIFFFENQLINLKTYE